MNSGYPVRLAGEELWLLPEKAMYWPAQQVLLIADVHFGKAAAYRSLGQPVPHGTTASNIAVIDRLLAKLPCRLLIFLGDFLHAPESHAPGTLSAILAWRERYHALAITLIRGNHDKRAGDPPSNLRIAVVPEPLLLGPFALQHEPDPHVSHHVLAGHVHPAYRLYGKGRQRLRLPCFYLGENISILPAFGAFTGGMNIQKGQHNRVYVVGDGAVWEAG